MLGKIVLSSLTLSLVPPSETSQKLDLCRPGSEKTPPAAIQSSIYPSPLSLSSNLHNFLVGGGGGFSGRDSVCLAGREIDSPARTQMMASLPRTALLLLLLLAAFLVASVAAGGAADGSDPTAYEMLEKYGFPRGLLPEGVTSYALRDNGTFEAHLGGGRGDCDFAVDGGYLLSYKRKVTGRLDAASGALRDLRGVSVKVLFVWFGINEVVKADGKLSFFVGPLSASFPLSNFEECPHCRCGFDCAAAAVVASS